MIGGLHFFALGAIDGQPATLARDALEPPIDALPVPRAERACTAHVFFGPGGNGSVSAGPPPAPLPVYGRLPAWRSR